MARLIDADELLMDFTDIAGIQIHGNTKWSVSTMRNAIRQAPTVDAVKVVRCKDCKHYWKNISTKGYDGKCVLVYDDDFCSKGAKMDGGE